MQLPLEIECVHCRAVLPAQTRILSDGTIVVSVAPCADCARCHDCTRRLHASEMMAHDSARDQRETH